LSDEETGGKIGWLIVQSWGNPVPLN